jgi:hypothetical protein
MGIEKFFFRGESAQKEEETPSFRSRRRFLVQLGAFAASAALPQEVLGSDESAESQQELITQIHDYERLIRDMRPLLEDEGTSREDLVAVIGSAPGITREALRGSELDPEPFFRSKGSWPSEQIPTAGSITAESIHFAHETDPALLFYGNGFFVNGEDPLLITNSHVSKGRLSHKSSAGEDIAGEAASELFGVEKAQEDIARTVLSWDRRKEKEDLHGRIVHIPSVRKFGGEAPDSTELTTGVLIKMTPSMLKLFSQRSVEEFGETLLNSYICIVPSRDVNEDLVIDNKDREGTSGSPIFTQDDSADGRMIPSGIVWGDAMICDYIHNVAYTALIVHGPDILGKNIDAINTVVSGFMSEAELPQKRALTEAVQERLKEKGFPLTVDGVYGGGTQDAVFKFQQRSFPEETLRASVIWGDVDRMTWNALFPERPVRSKKELYAQFA